MFSTGADSRAQRFAYHLYDFTWQVKRIELKPMDSALIGRERLAGTYVSEELGVALVLHQNDDALVVRGHRWNEAVLRPFQPDAFTTDQAHMGYIALTRDALWPGHGVPLYRPTDGVYRVRSGAEIIGADGALQLASNTPLPGTLWVVIRGRTHCVDATTRLFPGHLRPHRPRKVRFLDPVMAC